MYQGTLWLKSLLQQYLVATPAHQAVLVPAGSENGAVLPLEMLNEGFKASSPGLMIADVRFKGGMYVELTQTNQHVEYIYVNTIATEDYQAFCGMAYDAPARNDTSTRLVINPGTCGAVPCEPAALTACLYGVPACLGACRCLSACLPLLS